MNTFVTFIQSVTLLLAVVIGDRGARMLLGRSGEQPSPATRMRGLSRLSAAVFFAVETVPRLAGFSSAGILVCSVLAFVPLVAGIVLEQRARRLTPSV